MNNEEIILGNTGFMLPAKMSDAKELLENIREEDLREIKAAGSKNPLESIEHGILFSSLTGFTYAVRDLEGRLCMVFGVLQSHLTTNAGIVWMLGTNCIESVAFEFLRHCKEWVKKMNELFPYLYNMIDSRNTMHLKWLQWCGFDLVKSYFNYGTCETAFIHFEKKREGFYV